MPSTEPPDCDFCDVQGFRQSDVCRENDHCLYAASFSQPDVLPGSGVIVPLTHRSTLFDLTSEEWHATRDLLLEVKVILQERWRPDRYTIGWNCAAAGGQKVMHAHLHVIPRFADEPLAGTGFRWFLRQPENRRLEPSSPGRGRALTECPAER